MSLRVRRVAVFVGLAIAVMLAIPSTAGANPNRDLSCRAAALRATILTLPPLELVVANAKDLPCDSQTKGLLNYTSPNLSANVLSAKTKATVSSAHAESSVAKASIAVPDLPPITADVLTSSADVTCQGGIPVLTGTSEVSKVTIGALVINAPVGPAVFNLGVGVLYLNETTLAPDRITTRALHLVAPGIAEVVIAESTADFVNEPC